MLVLLITPAAAETWPTRPVRVVVPYAPGSTPDIVARMVTASLSDTLGQPFVVDNRSGASGNIGADAVAKARPDGYTLLIGINGPIAVNKALFDSLPYDPERDLAPIALLVRAPQIFVVNPSLPIANFADFVAHAKAHPGQLSYGTVGSGSASHLTMEELKFRAGLDLVHVPYRGFPPAIVDLIAGQIQASCAIAASVTPYIDDGKLRALAITTAQRSSIAPAMPTVAELGYPELESYAWQGLLAPTGTPRDVIDRLNTETVKLLRQPALHDALVRQGYEVIGDTPEAFGSFIHAETEKWTAVIRRTGAHVEQ
ncbi:MAG: tripartite tricarboxylate transporter substrate binding protein [Pseudomonadota bacterium]